MIDVKNITSSLSEYSPTVSKVVNLISDAMIPIGIVLLSFFLLQEMLSWYQFTKREGSGISIRIIVELLIKYIIGYFLIYNISDIFTTILWFINGTIDLVNGVVSSGKTAKVDYDIGKVKGVTKIIIKLIVSSVEYIASVTGNLLIMLRFLQMYLLKAIAPPMVAFFMSESTKQITINFIKHFCAYAIQGLLLLIVARLYPSMITDTLLKAPVSEGTQVLLTAFSSILKGIIFIAIMVGTNRLSKQLLGVS